MAVKFSGLAVDTPTVRFGSLREGANLKKSSLLHVLRMLPAREAVCAVIVTFHPGSGLFTYVERVAKQVSQVVILDNGSTASCVGDLRQLADRLRLHLILNSYNEAIASAMNQ